jgi:DNA-binding transcriptional ArsR family regulator
VVGRPVGRPGIVTAEPVAMPKHELLARVFRTLGDHTRLRILEYLRDVGGATQRELVEHTRAPQPRVSEHLGCLTWCGLVVSEPEGRSVRYRLHEDFADAFLDLAERFVSDNAIAVGCCTVLDEDDPGHKRRG